MRNSNKEKRSLVVSQQKFHKKSIPSDFASTEVPDNNPNNLPNSANNISDLQDTAFELICRHYELTQLSEIAQVYTEQEEFKEKSEQHLQAFERAEIEWALLGQLQPKTFSFTQRSRFFMEHTFASVNDNPKPVWAMASVIFLAIILPFLLSFQNSSSQIISQQQAPINKNIEHYRTGYGYRSEYVLNDGSVVNLNWNTSISVNFTKNQRLVTLHQGEAYFKVAKNAHSPFIVSVDNVKAQAIGTEFNVKKRADNVADIAVTEGVVEVTTTSSHQNEQKELQKKMLVANEVVTSIGAKLSSVNRNSSDKSIAWRQGLIIFDKQPLGDALKELNRYTSYDIIINSKQLNDEHVTANFFVDSADDAMYSLVELFNLRVEKHNDSVIISTAS